MLRHLMTEVVVPDKLSRAEVGTDSRRGSPCRDPAMINLFDNKSCCKSSLDAHGMRAARAEDTRSDQPVLGPARQFDDFLGYAGLRPDKYGAEETMQIDYKAYVSNMMAGKTFLRMTTAA
jgi:hypothetical protein